MLNYIWIVLIIIILFISFKLNKFINYNNYKFISIIKSLKNTKKGLFLTLGTKIGVGSIIGTAAAIQIGGIGSILWIIVFSLLTSSIIYYESILGSKYKKRMNSNFIGGPYFYIRYGLNKKILAVISTVLLVVCYSFFFQMIQTNTVSNLILINTNININIISLAFLFLLILTVFFSLKELLSTLNKIVPFMCIFLMIISIVVIIKNYNLLPVIISLVVKDAFTLKGILIGALIGIKRSIFLNELLIGTTSIASSVDECDSKISAKAQVFGAYLITFIICLLISFLIIIFYYNNNIIFENYILLINNVFIYHFGNIGTILLIILVILFSVTTIISGFYIGISNLKYISKNKILILFFKLFMILFTMSGIYLNADYIWNLIDLIMLILIIINLYCIIKLFRRRIL